MVSKKSAQDDFDDLEDVVEDVFPAIILSVVFASIILSIFLLRHYTRYTVHCTSKNKLDGKTVIITGANTGIGKATAMELARRQGRIILACRDMNKGEAVVRKIRKKTGNQNVFFIKVDLGSLVSIKDFVEEFNRKEGQLHILINNAAYLGPKKATIDGFEMCFGMTFLGHFYLTYLLVDKLKKYAPSRVINVLSDSYVKGKIDFEDLAMMKGYDMFGAYARSKLAQAIFTVELHRRYFAEVVQTFAVHPGSVHTDLLRNWPGLNGNFLRVLSRVIYKPPEDGCQTIVHCAVKDGIKDCSGRLLFNCKAIKFKDFVRDKDMGRKLWNTSLHLVGLDCDIEEPEEEPAPAPHAAATTAAAKTTTTTTTTTAATKS